MDTTELKKLTKEQMIALLEQKIKAETSGLQVKLNSAGGVYIRSTKFKEFSNRTQKEYIAGINVPFITAKVLFNDEALLKEIRDSINNMK